MKKIAIIGAGFSGLGACYHLLQLGGDITVFDGKGIGGGASGVASGLLHPYPGEDARLSWNGKDALEETKKLLKLVGPSVYKENGILRLALSERQEKAFKKRAQEQDDVEWWDAEKCKAYAKGVHFVPGIFIKSGVTVHASLYLNGLWNVCEKMGALFKEENVSLRDLDEYDHIVVAAGGGIRDFDFKNGPQLKFNKGQILACEKPKYWTGNASIIGKGYLAMSENDSRCFLGSTYEKEYLSEEIALGVATDLILSRTSQFIVDTPSFKVLDAKAGIRVCNVKTYHPIISHIDERVTLLTAMGSRGLLYHSYFAKTLAQDIMEEAVV